jgi:hypothetical protein
MGVGDESKAAMVDSTVMAIEVLEACAAHSMISAEEETRCL